MGGPNSYVNGRGTRVRKVEGNQMAATIPLPMMGRGIPLLAETPHSLGLCWDP